MLRKKVMLLLTGSLLMIASPVPVWGSAIPPDAPLQADAGIQEDISNSLEEEENVVQLLEADDISYESEEDDVTSIPEECTASLVSEELSGTSASGEEAASSFEPEYTDDLPAGEARESESTGEKPEAEAPDKEEPSVMAAGAEEDGADNEGESLPGTACIPEPQEEQTAWGLRFRRGILHLCGDHV